MQRRENTLYLHFNCAEEISWKILKAKLISLIFFFFIVGKLKLIFQKLMMFLVYLVCIA